MLYTSNHRFEQFSTFRHQYNGNARVSFEDQKVTSGFLEDPNFRERNLLSGAPGHCNGHAPIEHSLKENSSFSDCSDEQDDLCNSLKRNTRAHTSFFYSNHHRTQSRGVTLDEQTLDQEETIPNGFQNPSPIGNGHWNQDTKIIDHVGQYNDGHWDRDTKISFHQGHQGRHNHEHWNHDTRIKDYLGRYNCGSFPSTNVTGSNFGVSRDIGTCDSYFEAVSDDDCRFRHFRADHLSEIQFENSGLNAPAQWTSFPADRSKKKKKRYRPFAAQRERERLAVMNSALRKLKMCLPLEEAEQKLSKKEILQTAILYIKYLSKTLDQESTDETLNLNEHNYILNGLRCTEGETSSS